MGKRSICLYFQVHQPFRLRTYRFFDIGHKHDYYDDYANRSIMRKVVEKCYLPTNRILLELIKEYGAAFKVSFSISGSALDQFEMYAPDVLESFQKLAHTNNVEFLTETNAHSLCSLASKDEFTKQVDLHSKRIENLFGQKPKTFRNTELIYSDDIGDMVAEMGYKSMLTEGAKHVLGWKSPNYMYCSVKNPKLKILLKNFRLSDDIAFRFSNRTWSEWPLTAEKYVNWLNDVDPQNETINLFMDYETFGEHQWAETGIFDFLKAFPKVVFSSTDFKFKTPSELTKELQPVSPISVPYPISWADEERDLTAWLGNELQTEAFSQLFGLEQKVKNCTDEFIQRDWLRLQNSDHLYYMCTKWFSDGEVHKYFNPYNSPYEAFINYMNILSDFVIRVENDYKAPSVPVVANPVEEIKEKPAEITKLKKEEKEVVKKKNPVKKKVPKREKTTAKKEIIVTKKNNKNETLTFDKILEQPGFVIKEFTKTVDVTLLSYALKNADEEFKDTLLSFLGIRKLNIFDEEMNKIERATPSDVQKAQKAIVDMIHRIINKKK